VSREGLQDWAGSRIARDRHLGGNGWAMTPRLAEIIAAMLEAKLAAEDARRSGRSTVIAQVDAVGQQGGSRREPGTRSRPSA
jgi:hypothetical protein